MLIIETFLFCFYLFCFILFFIEHMKHLEHLEIQNDNTSPKVQKNSSIPSLKQTAGNFAFHFFLGNRITQLQSLIIAIFSSSLRDEINRN